VAEIFENAAFRVSQIIPILYLVGRACPFYVEFKKRVHRVSTQKSSMVSDSLNICVCILIHTDI